MEKTRPRIAWIDAARAFAVLAVLLMHYRAYVIAPLPDYPSDFAHFWRVISDELTPIRMPLLLFMSGILASSKLLGSSAAAAGRGISSLYLNTVWTTIYFGLSFLLVSASPGQINSWQEWLTFILLPGSNLWFVWALGAWAFLFISFKRLPSSIVLGTFAIANAVGILLRDALPPELQVMPVLRYGLYFAFGVYAKKYAITFFEDFLARKAVVFAACYVALDQLAGLEGVDRLGRVVLLDAQSIAGIGAVSAALAICCKWRPFSATSGYIGRRTLPLFVCHLPFLWLATNTPLSKILSPSGFEPLWPIFGLCYLVIACIAFSTIARKVGLSHLFDTPAFLLPQNIRK